MKFKRKRFIYLMSFLISPFFTFAQLDTVHWIPPLHSRDNAQIADHYIYLSTPIASSFVVTIKDGSGNIVATPTIDNANPFVYHVGNAQNAASPLFVPMDSLNHILTQRGLILSAPNVFYANLRAHSASQAESLTAKGKAALGTTFRIGGFPQVQDGSTRNFTVGLMATQPNTSITISNYDPGILFAGSPSFSAPSISVTLNQGECYVISGYTNTAANLTGIIGALVQSDKPIVMNNGNLLGTIANNGGQDMGIDQSVPIEKTGKNYILIEGGGSPEMEEPIVISHYDSTSIFVNGSGTPVATINAGQFYLVANSNYQGTGNRNMLIRTSKPAYMYQALAGSTSDATGALNFIPPFSCYLQDSIDLIPSVEKIGSTNYTGGVMIFTQQGATLQVNGVTQTGAVPVLSVPWETYKIMGLTGNVKIKSTGSVAAGIFGASGAAGYAGYFAGFDAVPLPTTYTHTAHADTCFSIPTNFYSHYDMSVAVDSLLWDFGDPASGTNDTSSLQNPSHTFSASGLYTIKLIVFRCENDTVIDTVRAFAIPTANFLVSDICYKDSAHFTNTSSVDSSSSYSPYSWDFGDGSQISTLKNPSHFYPTAGTFPVSLVVTSTSGCMDTIIKDIVVHPLPIVDFSAPNVCEGNNLLFNSSSSIPITDTIQAMSWNFRDGSPFSFGQNASHLYPNPGADTTELVVVSNFGCTDSIIKPVFVNPNPTAKFGSTTICFGIATAFTDSSTTPSSTITTWAWDFGNGGSTNTSQNPAYTYSSPGIHFATLIISDSLGCFDTVTNSVLVYYNPVPNFSHMDVCLKQPMSFSDSSGVVNDTVTNWFWNFGDATALSTNQNPTHVYANDGIYAVSLMAITDKGCVDSITKNVVVHPLPTPKFNAANVCLGVTTTFIDVSTIPTTDTLQSRVWNFGDGSPVANNQTVSHQYTGVGTYPVQLISTSTFGCTDTLTKPSIVNPNPVVNYTANDTAGCEAFCISFQNLSAIQTGINSHFVWDFGDSSPTSSLQDVFHCYTNDSIFLPAFYSPVLTVTSDSGCVTSKSKTNYITVFPSPNAIFTVQPQTATMTDPLITITNLSTGASLWNWTFGDTASSVIGNPGAHAYADTGTYQITLITSNQYSCGDTAYQTIVIEPDFIFYIPNAFTPNDDGVNDIFTGNGMFVKEFEMSIFDRWGNLIYKTDSIDKPWDGKANKGNEQAQREVYIYAIKVTDFKSVKHVYRGVLTLVR
jgi:gliding motility-associated-like protein